MTSPGEEADALWFSWFAGFADVQVCRFCDSFLKFPFFSKKSNLKCLVVARQEGEESLTARNTVYSEKFTKIYNII